MNVSLTRLLDTRAPLARAALAVRLAAGVTFLGFSLGKFIRHGAERAAFERYGIPFPDMGTYLIGGLELVGGTLFFCAPALSLQGRLPEGKTATCTVTIGP